MISQPVQSLITVGGLFVSLARLLSVKSDQTAVVTVWEELNFKVKR